MPAVPIEPDTKDWTWVLERVCPECGFDAAAVDLALLAATLVDNADRFATAVLRDGATTRSRPSTWSVLEYTCHVRDVHRVFDVRVRSMLETEDPLFANWDQDAAALEGRYDEQSPTTVAGEVVEAAAAVAARYAGVTDWSRPGRRSNGSTFSLDTIARYHLHDVVHHAVDVGAHDVGSGHEVAP